MHTLHDIRFWEPTQTCGTVRMGAKEPTLPILLGSAPLSEAIIPGLPGLPFSTNNSRTTRPRSIKVSSTEVKDSGAR
jgi:hypothetical protein